MSTNFRVTGVPKIFAKLWKGEHEDFARLYPSLRSVLTVCKNLWDVHAYNADGEIRRGLFLVVHGRSLHVLLSGFVFFYVRDYSQIVVGVPVNVPVKLSSFDSTCQAVYSID